MKSPLSFGCNGVHPGRRDFLRVGSLSLLGIHLSQFLAARRALASPGTGVTGKAQACILLYLDGGPSQIDTWDPKPSSGFRPISTNVAGIQISELFPRVARQMDKLAIIRSLHTEENNHGQAMHYLATGHRPNPAMTFPSFSSIITKEIGPRNQVPPHAMVPAVGGDVFKAQFLGAQYDPMVIPDPSKPDFQLPDLSLPKSVSLAALEDRRAFLAVVDRYHRQKEEIAEFTNLDTFRRQAWKMILSPAVKEAFDLSKETEKTKDAYGRTTFGQSVLMARRLVEAGSRFVTAGGYKFQAWDTHYNNDQRHRELGPSLDQTLSTLIADLDQRGLLESTIVIVAGEFGRTPHINPILGRDHWPECWSIVLGGGGIRGGQVVGTSDERGAYPAERMVTMGEVFATIYKAFGIDWRKEYMHPIGRPLKIANSINDETGAPIRELI